MTLAAGDDLLSRCHNFCGHLNPRFRASDGNIVYGTTCNMSLALASMHRLQQPAGALFDAAFPGASYEDVELCVRNAAHGCALSFAPAAVVRHDFAPRGADDPEEALFKRFARYGGSEHILFELHPWCNAEVLYGATRALNLPLPSQLEGAPAETIVKEYVLRPFSFSSS